MKHELNHNNSFLTRTLTALATACSFAASCALASCDLFNVSVPDYFEEYTNTAAVVSHALDGSYPENSDKVTCLPSGSDRVVTFTLRNPQQYELVCSYSFSGSNASLIQGEKKYITFTQNDDKTELYATIKDTLLSELDCSTDKDLTFTLNMTEPKSGRTFDPYTVTLSANSAPPVIQNGVACTNNAGTYWVVCFNIPGTNYTANGKTQSDITSVTINSTVYPVTFSSGTVMFTDSSLSTTGTVYSNPKTGLSFTAGSGAETQPVYFTTTDTITNNKDKTYTVTLTDSAGLSSTSVIYADAAQLSAPSAQDNAVAGVFKSTTTTPTDNPVTQNADGTGTVKITAAATTAVITYTDASGTSKTTTSVSYDSTGASIAYTVSRGSGYTTSYASGTISGLNGTIAVPAGDCKITAVVQKARYADSTTMTWYCHTTRSRMYVSSAGNDNNDGSAKYPVATVGTAITNFDTLGSTNYIIYVLSNLSNSGSGDYITINNSNLSVTIQGSDTSGTAVQRTIDAKNTGSVFKITNAAVTLKNLTLTGGNAANGGGINITSGSVTLSGGTIITGNKATSAGGGIYIAKDATVTVQGGTVITPSGTGTNDVYLASDANLSVGTLTGSGTVACITPVAYTVGEKILSFTDAALSDSEKVALCDRFAVTKKETAIYVVSPEGNNGILAQPGITIDGLAGTYTFAVSSVPGDSVTTVTEWDAGAAQSLYWVIKDSTGTAVCSSATCNKNVTGAVISIYSHTTALQTGSTANDGYTGTVTAGTWIPAGDYSIKMTATIGGYEYTGSVAVTVK